MSNFIARTVRRWIKSAVEEALRDHETERDVIPTPGPPAESGSGPDSAGPPEDERTVNTYQAADILGVSYNTIGDYCRDGRVPAHKDEKGRWRIPLRELYEGPLTKIVPNPR